MVESRPVPKDRREPGSRHGKIESFQAIDKSRDVGGTRLSREIPDRLGVENYRKESN